MNKLEGMPGDLFRMITTALGSGSGPSGTAAGKQADAQRFRDFLHAFSQQKKSTSTLQPDLEPAASGKSPVRASGSSAQTVDPGIHHDSETPSSSNKQDAANKQGAANEQDAAKEVLQQLMGTSQSTDQQTTASLLPQAGQGLGFAPLIVVAPIPSAGTVAGSAPQAGKVTGSASRAGGSIGSAPQAGKDAGPLGTGSAGHSDSTGAIGQAGGAMRGAAPAMPSDMPTDPGFEPVIGAKLGSAATAATSESGATPAPEIPKFTVVQRETHFPPVSQQTVPQTIADSIVAEMKNSSATTATAVSDVASPTNAGPDQPLKVLTIQLAPASLGTVSVKFRLSGDAVTIHLAADRSDTTQMLHEQRDQIRDLMRSAGYTADVASVQQGSFDGLQSGTGQQQSAMGQHPQQQSQSQGSADTSGSWSGDAQGGAQQDQQGRRQGRESSHEQDVVPKSSRSIRYV